MIIKKFVDLDYLSKVRRSDFGKTALYALILLICYNVLLALIGLTLYLTVLPPRYQEKISDRFDVKKVPMNLLKGKTSQPDKFHIDIKHKHLRRLAYVRAMSLQKGVLYDWEGNDVPAIIRHGGESYRVKLSMKGRLDDHWKDQDMVSLKVKVRDDKTICGMKTFAFQHPRTRFYINEWILHKLFRSAGLISLRYDFVSVDINGRGGNIYALEEGLDKRLIEHNHLKEGPIIKFNRDFYWEGGDRGGVNGFGLAQDLWGSELVPLGKKQVFADTLATINFHKGKSLLEAFRRDELSASDVFDVPKLAMYFALIDLIGYAHPSTLDNVRFYYNPITSLIEPIIHDAGSFFRLKTREGHPTNRTNSGMVGTERYVGKKTRHDLPPSWKSLVWYGELFKDSCFYGAYVRALEAISSGDLLDNFVQEYRSQFENKRRILHKDYPLFRFDPFAILYQNQEYIKEALQEERLIQVYYDKAQSSSNQVKLDVVCAQNFPIKILEVTLCDSIDLAFSGDSIIQANVESTPRDLQVITLHLSDKINWRDSLVGKLKVSCAILGSDQAVQISVISNSILQNSALTANSIRTDPNVMNFNFLRVDEERKLILFEAGRHDVTRDLVIPRGYNVIAKGGTHINILNGSSIFSNSPITWIGTLNEPIVLSSSDLTGQGVTVVNADTTSTLHYVYFEDLSMPDLIGDDLIGTMNFYHSSVQIDHCIFRRSQAASCHLNIARAEFDIANSQFLDAGADALFGDFCSGTLKNTQFRRMGGTALQFFRCRIDLKDISIHGAKEMGLKAGSQSTVVASQASIGNAKIAVCSQDLSKIILNSIVIEDCEIAYATFQKDHGPSLIEIEGKSTFAGHIDTQYLIDDESRMIVSGREIKSSDLKVEIKDAALND